MELTCNRFLAGVQTNASPFDAQGACHNKGYTSPTEFMSKHFFGIDESGQPFRNSTLISIQITADDLLPLTSISLLRAGNYNLNNNELEVNTYNKLNDKHHRWALDNILDSFFRGQIQSSYRAVKDPSWPDVDSLEDFQQLPAWIQQECLEQHNLKLLVLDQHNPNCPRWVLREFFKLGFLHPEQSGYMTQQARMIYDNSNQVYVFPYRCFYNTERFVTEIEQVGRFAGYSLQQKDQLVELHKEFLARQPYKHAQEECDLIFDDVVNRKSFTIPKIDLLKEAYLEARLESHYLQEVHTQQNHWFDHSTDIHNYFLA